MVFLILSVVLILRTYYLDRNILAEQPYYWGGAMLIGVVLLCIGTLKNLDNFQNKEAILMKETVGFVFLQH